jgi:hypothetical protein
VCFFTSPLAVEGRDAELPRPYKFSSSSVPPEEMGNNKALECVRCHMPIPFIRTPLIRHRDVARSIGVSVRQFPNKAAFEEYMSGDEKGVPWLTFNPRKGSPIIPVIAKDQLERVAGNGKFTTKVSKEPILESCQTCHLMAGGRFQARHVLQAFGICDVEDVGDPEDPGDSHCKSVHPRVDPQWLHLHNSVYAPDLNIGVPVKKSEKFRDYFLRCRGPESNKGACNSEALE